LIVTFQTYSNKFHPKIINILAIIIFIKKFEKKFQIFFAIIWEQKFSS
jgi:hypothetical protein